MKTLSLRWLGLYKICIVVFKVSKDIHTHTYKNTITYVAQDLNMSRAALSCLLGTNECPNMHDLGGNHPTFACTFTAHESCIIGKCN